MQDLFFKQYKFEHFIEVGSSLMLTDMVTHILKAKYKTPVNAAPVVVATPPPITTAGPVASIKDQYHHPSAAIMTWAPLI